MNPLLLLAINDFTTIKLIGALIIGAYWLINYLRGARPAAPPVVQRPNVRRPGPNQADGANPPRARTQESLASEIEQFLQEAAQRKRDKGRRPAARVAPQPPRQPELPIEAELLEPPTGEAVADSVQRHLDNREFNVRASQLTEDMQRADQQREEHFRKTFDRRLGALADTSQGEPQPGTAGNQEPAESPAAVIAGMLARPESVRQAIVLNEILARPAERW